MDGFTVYLADFGISNDFVDVNHSETTGPTYKTVRYAAPEMVKEKPRGRPVDIFSLGCVFLEMLSALAGLAPAEVSANFANEFGETFYHQNATLMGLNLQKIKASVTSTKTLLAYHYRVADALKVIGRMMSFEPDTRPKAGELFDEFEGLSDFVCPTCHPWGKDYYKYAVKDTELKVQ